MQQSEVFHSHWLPTFPFMHRARERALGLGIRSVVAHGATLTVREIGRHWSSDLDTKHGIKAADRLVGNPHLAAESEAIYQVLAGRILKPDSRPVVLVDWSDAHPDRQMHILRATVKFAGRSLVLYEQVFPLSLYNSRRAHQEFLRALARVLPKGVSPILVTDAGFRNPWFREVQAMGWDWLGRVRSTAQWRHLEDAGWQELTELHAQAGRHGQWLGQVQMARETPHQGYLYLAPKPHKARRKPSRNSNTRNDKRNRKSYSQPWVLFSSLDRPATEIIQLYRQRMTIEAGFRDLKSARFGMGMEYRRVTQLRRLKVLLLIAALAMWVLASIGWMARIDGISRRLQANTVRDTEVLSVLNIARCLFEKSKYHDWLRGCRFDNQFAGIGSIPTYSPRAVLI